MAAAHGHLPVVERLLAGGADADTEGSISTSVIYLNNKIKVKSKKYTPLKVAKENGYNDIVEVLKKAGAKK